MLRTTELKDNCYTINSGGNSLAVDPNSGGRIISLQNSGFEFLTGKDVHPENYGSTFWPSPQSKWNWPPPEVLDKCPYSQSVSDGAIIMGSSIDPRTGIRFIKEFRAGGKGTFNISYKMLNASLKPLYAAPWEITRVKKGGVLLFPIGESSMRKKQFQMAQYEITEGIAWYKDDHLRPGDYQLNMADGLEGWMAYALDNKLFVKKFSDVKPNLQAPGEAEILFYVSPEADYIEIEVQGKYEALEPSGSISWKMTWMTADVPTGLNTSTDIIPLADFVRNLIR